MFKRSWLRLVFCQVQLRECLEDQLQDRADLASWTTSSWLYFPHPCPHHLVTEVPAASQTGPHIISLRHPTEACCETTLPSSKQGPAWSQMGSNPLMPKQGTPSWPHGHSQAGQGQPVWSQQYPPELVCQTTPFTTAFLCQKAAKVNLGLWEQKYPEDRCRGQTQSTRRAPAHHKPWCHHQIRPLQDIISTSISHWRAFLEI